MPFLDRRQAQPGCVAAIYFPLLAVILDRRFIGSLDADEIQLLIYNSVVKERGFRRDRLLMRPYLISTIGRLGSKGK